MTKRKLVKAASVEESDLSPPPNGLLEEQQRKGDAQAPTSKKRKVKEAKDETVNEGSGVKKLKKSHKKEVTAEASHVEATGEVVKNAQNGGKKAVAVQEDSEVEANGEVVKKVKRKCKTKEEKEAEAMPLAARTTGHKLFIGAHVSAAGG